ncbi:MAG TPA: alpha/beta fold hydrolase, partial [Aggregatilineales bacterium]|nr:alpha/beta fold hydrolase [Aggregatilineales bacterium]
MGEGPEGEVNRRFLTLFACAIILAVAGCDSSDSGPVATLTPADVTIIAASATVAPVAPTANDQDSSNLNVQQFTPGARTTIVAGTPVFATSTAGPTETSIKMQFAMNDGLTIVGTFYSAPHRPAPAILLLHMLGSNKESWQPFAVQLQAAGYSVLAIDLRGHGESGGAMDWTKAPGDVDSVVGQMHSLPGIDPNRLSVIGASIGANLALVTCADTKLCHSAVLISPSLDYEGIKTLPALGAYGKSPLLIVASRDDKPAGADSPALD